MFLKILNVHILNYKLTDRCDLMKNKNVIIKGTFLLTLTGIITKIIGFYYRIFLNNTIGAEGMGIYQLIFPVFITCFSFCCVGIQTSLSRMVATSHNNPENAVKILCTALFISCFLASIMMILCNIKAEFIATYILKDSRCIRLVEILSYSFIPASIHSCINGFYYGLKKTAVPSLSQLFEQIIRVAGVYFIFKIIAQNNIEVSKSEKISVVVWGLFIGEAASALMSVTAFFVTHLKIKKNNNEKKVWKMSKIFNNLLKQAIPLTLNRLSTNFLQSIEAVIFPLALCRGGATKEDALVMFGIFTGMALPLIAFPSALTNSLSVLLVSDVAESDGNNNERQLAKTIQYTSGFTLFLGIFCFGFFFENGYEAGIFLFNSETAGEYITLLSFICPFFYLTSTLGSILHGLGKTTEFFVFNIGTIILRLVILWFGIPYFGIKGYVFGLMLSQIILTVLILMCLYKKASFNFNLIKWLALPVKCSVSSYILIILYGIIINNLNVNLPNVEFASRSLLYCIPFIITSAKLTKNKKLLQ